MGPRTTPIGTGQARHWLDATTRAAAGAVAFPIAILLHELGHFAAYVGFGFSGVVLRYASVGWADRQEFWRLVAVGNLPDAAALADPFQVAVGVAAGPVMTYLTVIASILIIRRHGPLALALGVGLVAPLRWLPAGPILVHRLLGRDFGSGTDEARLALLTGFPEVILLVLGIGGLIGGWWLLIRAVPRGSRRLRLLPVLIGMAVGGPAWAIWLGPRWLP